MEALYCTYTNEQFNSSNELGLTALLSCKAITAIQQTILKQTIEIENASWEHIGEVICTDTAVFYIQSKPQIMTL